MNCIEPEPSAIPHCTPALHDPPVFALSLAGVSTGSPSPVSLSRRCRDARRRGTRQFGLRGRRSGPDVCDRQPREVSLTPLQGDPH
jgi:hypothetical protein